jgi:hypothetical protein
MNRLSVVVPDLHGHQILAAHGIDEAMILIGAP